jgi:hypothetical protein
MTYTLYPVSSGGTAITNATWTLNNVSVQNGIYVVELDVTNVNLSAVNDVWVEVIVAGETLTPRIHLTSSSFAQIAATANCAATANNVNAPMISLVGVNGNPNYLRINNKANLNGGNWRIGETGATSFGSFGIYNETKSSQPMTISQNGDIGIGTSLPLKTLDVSGNLRVSTGGQWCGSSEMGFYADGNAALPIKVGSVMAGDSYNRPNPGVGNIISDTTGLPGVGSGAFGLYGGLGSLPGYPSDRYPTLRTTYTYLYFSAGGSYSAYMTSAGVFTAQSDRNKKTDFQEISKEDFFNRIANFKIYQWRYKADQTKARHIGPFAQDMHKYFNTYEEKMLSPQDTAGVALLGVRHLVNEATDVRSSLNILEEQNKLLKKQIEVLERKMEKLEKKK